MLYFKVKPKYDRMYYLTNYTTPRGTKMVRCGMLVGDELLTEKEVMNKHVPQKFVDMVNVKKSNIFFSLGCRFGA